MSLDVTYPVIEEHQYGASNSEDRLLLFIANATDLVQWAGIPRKLWTSRMLYQRGYKAARARSLSAFWERASQPSGSEKHILSPTAITIGVYNDGEGLQVEDGMIRLQYDHPIDPTRSDCENLSSIIPKVTARVRSRLSADEVNLLEEYAQRLDAEGFDADRPEVEHDYVFDFAADLAELDYDCEGYFDKNAFEESQKNDFVASLEELSRPALVIDGQHRLRGAADSLEANPGSTIMLPVVAIPDATWQQQVYQFIVINEKAEKVKGEILTDIFGSSLTKLEQQEIRNDLASANVDVEARIASVWADREDESPFKEMIKLELADRDNPSRGTIKDTTIRQMIDQEVRGSVPWRSNNEFYEFYVGRTFSNREEWDSWINGKWKDYWYAFWWEVREYYEGQAGGDGIWTDKEKNLTKSVTLRLLQAFFMEVMKDKSKEARKIAATIDEIYTNESEEKKERLKEAVLGPACLPLSIDDFRTKHVREKFLDYLPIRIFIRRWVPSLDDPAGIAALQSELRRAYETMRSGNHRYVATNPQIFAPTDQPISR